MAGAQSNAFAAAQPAASAAMTMLPGTKRFNFAPGTSPVVAGYTTDAGLPFDNGRGFGWETRAGAPLNLSSESRDRNVVADQRLDTLVHMQSGRAPEGRWQLNVPNGMYALKFGLGDAAYADSVHVLRAEGRFVGGFAPNNSVKNRVFIATAIVNDGKLTLDQVGGRNTKINFIDVAPIGMLSGLPTTPVTPPTSVPLTPTTTTAPFTPTTPVTGGALTASTPEEYLGLGKRMVFSTVNNAPQPSSSFTLRNTGNSTVNVTGMRFAGTNATSFRLANGQPSTFAIPAGGSASVAVQFTPTVFETNSATLTVSNSTGTPVVISLGGMNATNFEDVHEPSLQAIFNTLGYKVNAGVSNEATNFISKSNRAVGDEVLSPYWKRADASEPVNLYPLAAYTGRTQYAAGPIGFNVKNSTNAAGASIYLPGGTNPNGGENQKLLPKLTAGSSTTWAYPASVFGIRYGGNFSDDRLNGSARLHNVRTYPAKDQSGAVIANTYLVGIDQGGADCCWKNFDYQEVVYLVTNIKPETAR